MVYILENLTIVRFDMKINILLLIYVNCDKLFNDR